MKQFPLPLPFKGNRTYLHGTDMYDGILAALDTKSFSIDGPLRFRINRIAQNAVDVLAFEAGETVTRPRNGVASLTIGGAAAFLVESDRDIEDRVAYDDNATDANVQISGDSIRLSAAEGLTAIEAIVAITRSLHRTALPSSKKRWMFTGLDLIRPLKPTDASDCTVTIETRLGVSLTKSAIVPSASGPLGHIYFSLVEA
jgi:hypothetical protein